MSDLGCYSICDMAKHLIMLKDAAWKDGFLAMDIVVENNSMSSLLGHSIRLIVYGTEVDIIFSIIDQYIGSQNLDEEELVKAKMIRRGIEDIFSSNTSPYEMLVSMAKDLTQEEIIQLLYYLDKSTLERNLYGLSHYDDLPKQKEEADVKLQEVLKLESDQLLELLISMDSESIYFALKESSQNMIRKICEKIGNFVGSILTGYLRCQEPEGVYHEPICCQDKMAVVAAMLKEHTLIQFPVPNGNEKENKIIEEITLLQQVRKIADFSDNIVCKLKMAAIYRLGNRHGYYQELYFRLGFVVVNSNGNKMNAFTEYLAANVNDQKIRKMIEAGFELLLYRTYPIAANAMMYAAMRNGDFNKNIQHYEEIISKSTFHITIMQRDLKILRKIERPKSVNILEKADTSTEILRMLAGQKRADAIGMVYLMGDGKVRKLMEEYCADDITADILSNVLCNPLNNARHQNTLDILKYCSNLHSKLQTVYTLNDDELTILVNSIDEHSLIIVLKMESGELTEKIMKIRASIKKKMEILGPIAVYSQECNEALDKIMEAAAIIKSK